ncbi:unnamed protein product [Phyllotreta striolata]|uniref:MI domain-containing protein n=1 Tax=Phyllotreta striolata TaxID=444603 RepID=A0A9N9TWK5_PHYSR|nr:unnamed protein product [Phyllotreta striolata]
MKKQRFKQLLEANKEEDKIIQQMEKQLGLKKRKSKSIPKSFTEDGLDFLLEVVDPEYLKNASQQDMEEADNDFEEDFALMSGKPVKKPQINKTLKIKTDDKPESKSNRQKTSVSDEDYSNNDESGSLSEDDYDDENLSGDDVEATNDSNASDEEAADDGCSSKEDIPEKEIVHKGLAKQLPGGSMKSILFLYLLRRSKQSESKYIPPALRNKIKDNEPEDKIRQEKKLNRLRKQLKASKIEDLYMNNSRNDMNETLTNLIMESLVSEVIAPERLLIEHSDEEKDKYTKLYVLLAIKNNNVKKIPNYDVSYSEHMKKIIKGLIRKGNYVTMLNIRLEDLLKADERGKSTESAKSKKISKTEGFSAKLLELARQQRMNTDIRRNIFCIIMSAEDYLDAFEKLLKLGLKNTQEREIINILLHCCLQEKNYNPYYGYVAQKFCDFDRKYQLTIKYSIWDKLKVIGDHSGSQLSNLAKLLIHLFIEKGLPISILKIVQFSELDKTTLRFMRQIEENMRKA